MALASSTEVPPNFITIIGVTRLQDYADADYAAADYRSPARFSF
jgi:hypothetical protein